MRLDVFVQPLMRSPSGVRVCINFLIAAQLLAGVCATALTPGFGWADSSGGASYDYSTAIAADKTGNIYIAGEFRGTANFDSLTLNSVTPAFSDACLVKYNFGGNAVWARNLGGSNTDSAKAVVTDPAGNIYITGDFRVTAGFGTNTLNSAGAEDMFIAKYDPAGNLLWVRKGGGTGHEFGLSLAAGTNYCYLAGVYQTTANFSGTNLNSAGNYDIYIAKYDGDGNLLWIRSAGGTSDDRALGIATDNQGRCRITGYITSSSAAFGSLTVTNATAFFSDAFAACYDSNGNPVWASRFGGSGSERGVSVATDGGGNSYIAGTFTSTDMPGTAGFLANLGANDLFILKLDASGNMLWSRAAGGLGDDIAASIAVDSSGNCHITGSYPDAVTFGSTTLTNTGLPGTLDGYLAKYDTSGNFVWAKSIRGSDDESAVAVATDNADNVYVTGSFTSASANFDSITTTNSGNYDMFMGRIVTEQPNIVTTQTPDALIVSWPLYLQGYILESSTDPSPAGVWLPVLTTPFVSGNQRFVTNPITGGSQFFRLRKPL